MRTALCLLALAVFPLSAAEEVQVVPHVDSVGLFKNGVAVVRASFEAKQGGVYRWEDIPRPIHGSFWVESEGSVGVRSTTRMVEELDDAEIPGGNLQRDLAGQVVTVKLKNTAGIQEPELRGKVWMIPQATPRKVWDTSMPTNDPNAFYRTRWNTPGIPNSNPQPATTGSFLVLEREEGGRQYIDLSTLASVTADGPFGPAKRKVEKPVMLFEVGEAPRKDGRVRISYLTRGITWAPSYLIDLTAPDKLAIRRNAVVRNELMELKDTELQLISGFPNIEFAHVDSPLWAGGSLAAFFQQLGQPGGGNGSPAASQQMVMYNSAAPSFASGLPDLGAEKNAGDDVHFESIGSRTLVPGDSLSLETGSDTASCERVVEWVVADPRDVDGRYLRMTTGKEPEPSQAWDALKFTNPFKFPLTTGPATITEAGRFRGQSLSQWVNPGQSTCLRITKALSIQTRASEVEEEAQREQLRIGGRDYQRTKVKGTLTLHNFRGKEAVMNVRAEFSGEMLEAEGKPETKLRVEGVGSINPQRELVWTFKLAPGEEKTITYRYSVLVYL
jgi:hypothetical protein